MRHQKTRHKLSRDAAHRKSLLQNLCKEVIQHERIKTSEAKAKAVKPELEELITLAKRGDLHARRQALSALGQDKFTVHKLFEEVAPRYAARPGRLHPHPQAGPPSQRCDGDGLPRAGLSAGRGAACGMGKPPGLPRPRPRLELRRRGARRGLGLRALRGGGRAQGVRLRRRGPALRRGLRPAPARPRGGAGRTRGARRPAPAAPPLTAWPAPRPPRALPTARLDLEYDGGAFAGWARQPGRRTVQGELERALAVLVREPVVLSVAGRTDRGVHAWHQVASYRGPPVALRSLNALLPGDVAVRSCAAAPDGFDARRDARSRSYCYRLLLRPERSAFERGHALWWPQGADRDALEACAALLPGPHDFTAFTPTQSDHVRFRREVFGAAWVEEEDDVLAFRVEADAFLRHMNRVLVGTMLEVATGRRELADFAALLRGAPRAAAGPTAPPHGLHLAGVRY